MRWYIRTGTRPSSLAWTLAGSGAGPPAVAAVVADGCADGGAVADTAADVGAAAADVGAVPVVVGTAEREPFEVHPVTARITTAPRDAARARGRAFVRGDIQVPVSSTGNKEDACRTGEVPPYPAGYESGVSDARRTHGTPNRLYCGVRTPDPYRCLRSSVPVARPGKSSTGIASAAVLLSA